MKKWKTNNCTVYQVLEGRSNSFLVQSENNYLLVDTGRKNSWKELNRKLDHLLGGSILSCLMLTHTHFDHVENALKIKERYNTRIIVHKTEAKYLKRGSTTLPNGTNGATGFLVDVLGKRIQSRYGYEPLKHDILVDLKYDLTPFGFKEYIIHTPGHSKGSMSMVVDHEIAIVGDTMFGVFGNSVYPPFADNPEIMIDSWGNLLSTGCSSFLPGHGKEISRELLEKQYCRTYKNIDNSKL
jgi:hydroxyacylglutathione hydrolase